MPRDNRCPQVAFRNVAYTSGMPPTSSTSASAQNISFGPKRVEKKQEQTAIEKLSVGLLVLALLASAAVYGYRFYLQKSLTRIQSDIASAETVVTRASYEELVAFDRRVRAARYLLANRLEPSRVFTALESTVSESVFYQSFEAQLDDTGSLRLTLGGVSPEFAQIVLQSALYRTESLLSQVTVSGIEIREGDIGRDTLFAVNARATREALLASAPRPVARVQSVTTATTTPLQATTSTSR